MKSVTKRIISILMAILMLPVISLISVKADETITVFKQTDKQWEKSRYYYNGWNGYNSFAESACGPFSIMNAVFHLNGTYIHPQIITDDATSHNFHPNGGTDPSFYKDFAERCGRDFGFEYAGVVDSFDALKDELLKGNTAICSNYHHVMSIVKYRKSDGRFLLLDSSPNAKRRGTGLGYTWKTPKEFSKWRDPGKLYSTFYIFRSIIEDTPVINGRYQLQTELNRGFQLDIYGDSREEGAKVQVWSAHKGTAQVFTIQHIANGWHVIKHADSDKCLTVSGGDFSGKASTILTQWGYYGGNSQLWKFVKRRDDSYEIQSKVGYCLNVENAEAKNGNRALLWYECGTDAQNWHLVSAQ